MRNATRTKQIANWLAGSIAIVVIILIPLVFVSLNVSYVNGCLDSEVVINSRIISGLINANPEMWQYEQMRFEEILAQRPQSGEKEIRRIIDNQNNVIAESADELYSPLLKRSYDLKESGVTVGKIEIYRSLRPLLWNGLLFFIVGVLIAAIIFFSINILPFRALIQAEEELRKSEIKYKILTETSQTGIYIHQNEILVYANDKFAELQGYTIEEIIGTNYFDLFHPDERDRELEIKSKILRGEDAPQYHETKRVKKDGGVFWCQTVTVRIEYQGKPAIMGNVVDITDRKLAEEQRNMLIADLKKTLSEVKTLRGFLPICSNCKKIRDDKGYWNQIESYIHEHSDAEFSHSICPECAKKYYPDMDIYDENVEVTKD